MILLNNSAHFYVSGQSSNSWMAHTKTCQWSMIIQEAKHYKNNQGDAHFCSVFIYVIVE